MRLKGRTKLAFHMTLWAMVGIALLAVPALLSPTANKTDSPLLGDTRSPVTIPTLTSGSQSMSTDTGTESAGSLGVQDFVLRLLLVLIPAASFATFVKVWTGRRLRRN